MLMKQYKLHGANFNDFNIWSQYNLRVTGYAKKENTRALQYKRVEPLNGLRVLSVCRPRHRNPRHSDVFHMTEMELFSSD
jgi:hypothetical protein